MSQAEQGRTAHDARAPSGLSHDLSRRQIFAGAACAAAIGSAAVLPVAVAAQQKHPVVQRADAARAARNSAFWEAHREYRKLLADQNADDDRWRIEKWQDRVDAAELKMLLIGVTSVSAVRAKLEVTDDPRSYPLPGAARNLLQMVLYDLDRISMLEISGIAYPGEMA